MVGIQNIIYIDVCIFIVLALIPVICLKIWCTLYKNIQGMIAALEDPSWFTKSVIIWKHRVGTICSELLQSHLVSIFER